MENKQSPYILQDRIVIERYYNPKYGDSRMCYCGHTYKDHFGSTDNMKAIGCFYCDCYTFMEARKEETPPKNLIKFKTKAEQNATDNMS